MSFNSVRTHKLHRGWLVGSALLLLSAPVVHASQNGAGEEQAVAPEEFSIEHGKINTADASPVDPGNYEIEASYSFATSDHYWNSSGHNHDRGYFRENDIGLSFTAGLVEDIDVNLTAGYSWIKDNANDFDEDDGVVGPTHGDDFSDMEVSGRYRFYNDEQRHIELAYIAGVTIPTGSSSDRDDIGTSQEYWSFDQTLVASKDWGLWTGNVDIGYSLPIGNKRENCRGTLNTDIAMGYQVLPWLQPEVELNYSHDYLEDEDDAQTLAVTVGLVMPINEASRVNIGLQQGIWGENADEETSVVTAVKFAF